MTPAAARMTVVFTSLLGSTAYLVVQRVLLEVPPFTLATLRFALASAALIIFCLLIKAPLRWGTMRAAILPGCAFGIAMTCMILGLGGSLSSIAAFLTCSDAFMIPVVDRLLFKRRTRPLTGLSLIIGGIGLSFLTLSKQFSLSSSDAALLTAAFFWALYCSTLANVVKAHHPVSVSCCAHAVAAVVAGVAAALFDELPTSVSSVSWLGILYIAFIISALRFALKARAQTAISPSEMGLIFLLEPVGAAVLGVWLADEVLSRTQWIGAALVVLAVALPSLRALRRARRIHAS